MVATKKCGGCKNLKSAVEFSKNSRSKDGLQHTCKMCQAEWRRQNINKIAIYNDSVRQKKRAHSKQYRLDNLDKLAAYQVVYRQENKDELRVKDQVRKQKRRDSDPLYKESRRLRDLIKKSLDRGGFAKNSSTRSLLGADFATVHQHLVQTAIRNYGFYDQNISYHRDHAIPCSFAKDVKELEILQHYLNLQLLTPEDNLRKADHLDWQVL